MADEQDDKVDIDSLLNNSGPREPSSASHRRGPDGDVLLHRPSSLLSIDAPTTAASSLNEFPMSYNISESFSRSSPQTPLMGPNSDPIASPTSPLISSSSLNIPRTHIANQLASASSQSESQPKPQPEQEQEQQEYGSISSLDQLLLSTPENQSFCSPTTELSPTDTFMSHQSRPLTYSGIGDIASSTAGRSLEERRLQSRARMRSLHGLNASDGGGLPSSVAIDMSIASRDGSPADIRRSEMEMPFASNVPLPPSDTSDLSLALHTDAHSDSSRQQDDHMNSVHLITNDSSQHTPPQHEGRSPPPPLAERNSLVPSHPPPPPPLRPLILSGSLTNPQTRMTLSWTDIKYKVSINKEEDKIIIEDISGEVQPGEMIAIMGSSGAGKTTLLNILAGRVTTGEISGKIVVNGNKRTSNWKRVVGYVEQEDVMYRTLTVRETLRYAALLRLPRYLNKQQKYDRVEQVIAELGLLNCANTIIGDEAQRGISGGERKRVAIGIEVVTNPRLLFLDEPTSGLDSFTAYNIIESIGKLVKSDLKTVLMTIHQPREDILFLFDKILLLSQGKTIFFGPTQAAMDHLESYGYTCPRYMNPADFFLDTITVDIRSENAQIISQQRVNHLHEVWKQYDHKQKMKPKSIYAHGQDSLPIGDVDPILDLLPEGVRRSQIEREEKKKAKQSKNKKKGDGHSNSSSMPDRNNTWLNEMLILLSRNFKDIRRDRLSTIAVLVQTVVLFLLLGFTFFQLGYTQESIQSRIGALFFIPVNMVFSVIQPLITLFPLERLVMVRERYSSTYRVSTFFVAKSISILPFRVVLTLIYGLGLYYIIGFNPSAKSYFTFQGILLDLVFVSQGLGLLIGASVPNIKIAQIIGPLIILIFFIYGGNLANPQSVPAILRWLQYLSLIRYGYMAFFQNEFIGLTFTCNNNTPPTNGTCNPGFATGEQVIAQYQLNQFSITVCCLILLGMGIIFQILAYIALRISTRPKLKIDN